MVLACTGALFCLSFICVLFPVGFGLFVLWFVCCAFCWALAMLVLIWIWFCGFVMLGVGVCGYTCFTLCLLFVVCIAVVLLVFPGFRAMNIYADWFVVVFAFVVTWMFL